MEPFLSVFDSSPDGGRGLARDMPVRWALEEAGRPYQVRRLSFAALKEPEHLARQPFGQIPAYEEDGLVLFESGAIVLHVAEGCPTLLPTDRAARARAITWVFAAVNTVEPPVWDYDMAGFFDRGRPWQHERAAVLEAALRTRLGQLAQHLGDAEWLEGTFTAGDLMMICVLRRIEDAPLMADYPALAAYIRRGEARPAFQRAFAAQRALLDAKA
ncbi:MAG: glutathione S-transferase family protein [Novosphingobium sp.]|uniref:glutathione S-transferase family protein n=1 Tax=Novosphingobium sp. NDB2Meth1 TaxID=1892847 RepID=UPI0009302A55|nr:glutathione S-transferase family protein [Novosphingobium sp. NDB2Meth1]MBY0392617.1 glutathione S-transferase family protein [Novosphingobium sp.]